MIRVFQRLLVRKVLKQAMVFHHEIIHTDMYLLNKVGHAPCLTVPNPGIGMDRQEVLPLLLIHI